MGLHKHLLNDYWTKEGKKKERVNQNSLSYDILVREKNRKRI